MPDLSHILKLATESRNQSAHDLDTKSALEIATLMNAEDTKVATAIQKALPHIARVIDAAAAAISSGGRVIYVGAGTSGRLGALDASECPPTFGVSYDTVQYVMAGGAAALGAAAEANEDSRELGERDIAARNPGAKDLVVGIAASGRTPYTIAALEFARRAGSKTACVVCNTGSALADAVELPIEVEVGAEVVSGSTRLKAGTAQKLVLNMITTGAFTRLGYIYDNLMVNVKLSNEKLVERGIGILQQITAADRTSAERALRDAENHVPTALIMLSRGVSAQQARLRLSASNGNVRRAMHAASIES